MILEFQNIKKAYEKKEALREVSFSLQEGVCGLLGPNGAGKSTLMNIITGNVSLDEGRILLDGQDIFDDRTQFRQRLGYVPQQQTLYPDFKVGEFLHYVAALRGMNKKEAHTAIEQVLEQMMLTEKYHKKIKTLSGGMKQRLLIAQAILHQPDIIIMDEATAGLDPKQRIEIRNLIAQIAKNKIILLATHVVSDVEYIATDLVLMKNGTVFRHNSREQLIQEIQGKIFELKIKEVQLAEVAKQYTVANIFRDDSYLYVRVLAEQMPEKYPAVPVRPELEDVYLWHFGEV